MTRMIRGRPLDLPKTAAEYAAAYRENLHEARRRLEDARRRVESMRAAQLIWDDAESGNTMAKGPTAKQAWGDYVRASSDALHWAQRLSEAGEADFMVKLTPLGRKVAAKEDKFLEPVFAPDPRLPPEKDDDDCPF